MSTSITIPSFSAGSAAGTLSGIASQYGLSTQDILDANKGNTGAIPDPSNPNMIKAGGTLNIPDAPVIQTTSSQRSQTNTRAANLQQTQSNIAANSGVAPLTKTLSPGQPGYVPPSASTGTNNVGTSLGGSNVHSLYNPNGGTTGSSATGTGATGAGGQGNTQTTTGTGATTDTTSTDGSGGSSSSDSSDPTISSINTQIANIKSTGQTQIDGVNSTLNTLKGMVDSNAASTIASIQAMYGARMAGVTDAYQRLGAADQQAGFRDGMAEYTPGQMQGVLSDNEVNLNVKLGALQSQMMEAITKAQSAQTAGDTKAFNDAYDEIDKINTSMNNSVNALYKEATTYQANQLKAQQQSVKDTQTKLTDSMNLSKRSAPGIAAAIAGMSKSDQQAYIQEYAQQTGIDPAVLLGDVTTALQTQSKADLSAENTRSEINKRGQTGTKGSSKTKGGGTDGAYTYTPADISQYADLMNEGGTGPDGTKYNGRGKDGYVDPGTYISSYKDWISNGGTPKGFLKQFPNTNVNPSDYSLLPQALQPKAKTTTSSAPGI